MGLLSCGLQELPAELISYVARELDVCSLGVLRLTSRRIKNIFNLYFLQQFSSIQTIDLTTEGIQRLHTLVSSQDLKQIVRKLCIVCLYYHTTPASESRETLRPGRFFPMPPLFRRATPSKEPSPFQWPEDDVLGSWTPLRTSGDRQWLENRVAKQNATCGADLCEQLTKALIGLGSLDELALEAFVVLGPGPHLRWPIERVRGLPWRDVWIRTTQGFRIFLSAVARARIRLRKLVLYRDTKVCSIPIDQMNAALGRALADGFAKVASGLVEFSISISTHIISDSTTSPETSENGDGAYYGPRPICSGSDPSSIQAEVDDEVISAPFSSMNNLEALHMHFYQTKKEEFGPLLYKGLLQNVIGMAVFPRLRSITLQGLPVTSNFSQTLLQSCPRLDYLHLQYIHLDVDGWPDALEPFSSASIKKLYLSNLYSPQAVAPDMVWLLDSTRRSGMSLRSRNQNILVVMRDPGEVEIDPEEPRMGMLVEIDAKTGGGFGMVAQTPSNMFLVMKRLLMCGPPV